MVYWSHSRQNYGNVAASPFPSEGQITTGTTFLLDNIYRNGVPARSRPTTPLVSRTPTPSHALSGVGTCYLLIHQPSTTSMPSRVTWTPKHRISIAFNLIVLILPECVGGVPGRCVNSPWEVALLWKKKKNGWRHFKFGICRRVY